MNRGVGLGIGILIFAAGTVFTLQGVGVLKGSSMSNTTTWTVLGPIIAVIGAGIAVRAARKDNAAHKDNAARNGDGDTDD